MGGGSNLVLMPFRGVDIFFAGLKGGQTYFGHFFKTLQCIVQVVTDYPLMFYFMFRTKKIKGRSNKTFIDLLGKSLDPKIV